MDSEQLEALVREEVANFADVNGGNAEFYYLGNLEQHTYAVIAIPHEYKDRGIVGLMVRVVGDKVVIERDTNMDPLCEALMASGVPEEQIIFAYRGQQLE